MLEDFLAANHGELVKRCKAKVAKRTGKTPPASEQGVPVFIGQLIETLHGEKEAGHHSEPFPLSASIGSSAGRHGSALLGKGFTVDQVVHDYGDLCQALTELAHEKNESISVEEFHTFNRCLDDAMAVAVSQYGRERDQTISTRSNQNMNERLGTLAHELRRPLHTAMLALEAIKSGRVGAGGSTSAVLERNLQRLREVIDRSLNDARLTADLQVHRERISIDGLFEEVRVGTGMHAKSKGIDFTVASDPGLFLDADRPMLISAVENLLQNALKFTPANGHVILTGKAADERVVIEIADTCGGLAPGKTEGLFEAFEQRDGDRTGVGLGLSISRRCVEANGGTLSVRNVPPTGCIFAIDLPAAGALANYSATPAK